VRRLALVLLALAAPLGAQAGGGSGGARARLTGRVPEVAIAPVDSVVRAAAADDLPTEPLVQKALEGAAKHAPPGQIVEAVAAHADQLRQARTLLQRSGGPAPTDGEITSVAAAMVRGLPPPLAERIVTVLPDEPPGPALHAVADLEGHGFAEDAAVDLIVAAARVGLRGLRLLDVATAAVHELQRGATHDSALGTVRRALPDVPSPPKPSPAQVNRARRPRPGV
jgi:hypothetical protein